MTPRSILFEDRLDAGRKLGARMLKASLHEPIVYGLPRGGVPVAAEVARSLGAPLDIVLVRKLGVPFQPELALGAVVDGAESETVLNDDVVAATGVTPKEIDEIRAREEKEIERRRAVFLKGRARPDPKGRDAIVVDDGLATGATALAAIHALKRRGAARVILAVPLAPSDAVVRLAREADEVICLEKPEPFWGIGAWYGDFHQLDDAEVTAALDAAAAAREQAGDRAAAAGPPAGSGEPCQAEGPV
jgi:predicted phosphoribosyltransferase